MAFTCSLFSGCSTVPVSAANVEQARSRVPLDIAVELLGDTRGGYKFSGKYCYCVPLFPFGWFNFEAPDNEPVGISSRPLLFSPLRETQDILIDALKTSRIFTKVHLIGDHRKDKTGALVVRGKLIKASEKEKFWMYGLSFPGAILWLYGAPVVTSTEAYAVEIGIYHRKDVDEMNKRIKSAEKSEPDVKWADRSAFEPKPLWTFEAEKEISVVTGLYYKSNEFDKPALAKKYKCYRRYMAEVVAAEFIRALDKKLQENPDLFKPYPEAEPLEESPTVEPEKK